MRCSRSPAASHCPGAYDARLNDAPGSPLPLLRAIGRASRGIAVRHLLGAHGLAELVARYEHTLAQVVPLARAEFDTVRDFVVYGAAEG